jgi:V8-like Glu-specific endopeptidase
MTRGGDSSIPAMIKAIKDASRAAERSELSRLLREFVAYVSAKRATVTLDEAKQAVNALRGERHFAEMKMLADFFIRTGIDSPRLRTRYAQGLIETGEYIPAIDLLERLRMAEGSKDAVILTSEAPELSEIDGLIGRAWKDIGLENLNAGNAGLAARALNASYAAYRRGLMLNPDERGLLVWHGINLAGLQAVARRRSVKLAPQETLEDLAGRILAAVGTAKSIDELEVWDIASAAEASIALGRFDDAKHWFVEYLKHPQLDGFNLGSTIRQMGAIWNLTDTAEGAELLQLLVRFQLGRQDPGSEAVLTPGQMEAIAKTGAGQSYQSTQSADDPQSALNDSRAMPVDELLTAFSRSEAIGLIRRNFEALGTGFVATRRELGLRQDEGEDDRVIVTNSHVVSDPPDRDLARNVDAAHPEQVTITFTYPPERANTAYRIKRVLWNRPYLEHDISVLVLDDELDKNIKPLKFAKWPPHEQPTKAYIVGYPLGQAISFAFDNNRIVHIETYADDGQAKRLYYGTPTSPGNSGSPVFNERWDVVGIHHMGRAKVPEGAAKIANQGVLTASVCSAIRKPREPA